MFIGLKMESSLQLSHLFTGSMSIYGRHFSVISCGKQLCRKEQLLLVFGVHRSPQNSAKKDLHAHSFCRIPEILSNSNLNYSYFKSGKVGLTPARTSTWGTRLSRCLGAT